MSQADTLTARDALLERMMLVRAFEENNRAMQAAGGGHFPGTCTSIGQEAAAVGVVATLGPKDLIVTNHRSAGHLLARGADPGRMLAEIMGRSTGYCKGKSGSLHISVKELGIILTSTIVGGELSLAPGVGLSLSMLDGQAVVACFFGDGAACEGIFHESVNLAAVWNLPVLYVCENNEWQAYVHRKETMLVDRISSRAASYGIEGVSVDGNDVEAVYKAAADAVRKIRDNRKPILLETRTYRLRGHFEPDDQKYVDPKELSAWQAKDPIERMKQRLLADKIISTADIAAMEQRVQAAVAKAVEFAGNSPFPDAAELITDVYA
jgi:TPP-dependent pyruvate/acetoin dehydrogenase alpha subunit